MRTWLTWLTVVLIAPLVAVPAFAGDPEPVTVLVDTTEDTPIGVFPFGCDDPADGDPCTLREAVEYTNQLNQSVIDTIIFDPSLAGQTITLMLPVNQDGNQDGDLDITGGLIIDGDVNGDGVADITVSALGIRTTAPPPVGGGPAFAQFGPAHDRVFEVTVPSSSGPVDVTFANMTIRDGFTQSGGSGGGIYAESQDSRAALTVTLDNVVLTDNVANPPTSNFAATGGGVAVRVGHLDIVNTTIQGNIAQQGGGIAIEIAEDDSRSALTITDSTVTQNTTTLSPMASDPPSTVLLTGGGGIRAENTRTTITRSLITDNGTTATTTIGPDGVTEYGGVPPLSGGGVSVTGNEFYYPSLDIFDSLVADNTAILGGGGILAEVASVLVDGTTVDANETTDSGGAGAGLYVADVSASITNSTITGNVGHTGPGIANVAFEAQGIAPISGVSLTHVTVTDNGPDSTPFPNTGGLQTIHDTPNAMPTFDLINSIVESSAGLPACHHTDGLPGGFSSFGGNSENGTSCGLGADDAPSPTTQLLGTLTDNGGVDAGDGPQMIVPTIELLEGAEGVDGVQSSAETVRFAGTIDDCARLTDDQRNEPRPIDGDGDGAAACDRGAFERPELPPTDLAAYKTGPSTGLVGRNVTFSLEARNVGTTSADQVQITDFLPSGLAYVGSTGSCSQTSAGVITCDIGTIPAGSSASVDITATPTTTGPQSNSACVSTTTQESNTANNCASHLVTIASPPSPPSDPDAPPPDLVDVAVVKTGPTEAAVGDQVVFDLTVTNESALAEDVSLVDTLPAGLALVSASSPCTTESATVTCAVGTLNAGESVTVQVTATVEEAGTVINTACVTTSSNDTDDDNDCDDQAVEVAEVQTERIDGPERIATAIAGSQEAFPDGANSVVLTRSDLFPDAQAGTPLALDRDAPLLLSTPSTLTAETEQEILRLLQPDDPVYLLGGTAALSQAVFDRIVELGLDAQRIGGANRFGTATRIASELGDPATLLVADGGDFPAAVVAGAAAAVAGGGDGISAAVLLTSDVNIPVETRAYLDRRPDGPTLIAIGEPASTAFPEAAEAIVGGDPSELSANVAFRFFPEPRAVGVATAMAFPDGLTGGAVINRPAIGPGPILLTTPDALPAALRTYVESTVESISRLLIFGGSAAVSPAVEDELNAIIGAG